MTSPFDDENVTFIVLINQEDQFLFCLRRSTCLNGWSVVHHADSRKACLDFIKRNWTDM